MRLQLLFSLLGLFGSKIYAETEKKKLPVVFLCADLTALLSLSLWFIVFVEGELQSALNSMFTHLVFARMEKQNNFQHNL